MSSLIEPCLTSQDILEASKILKRNKNPEGFENPQGLQKDLTGFENLSGQPYQ